ncbi:MAG: 4Fe-4S binding protein [Euryarchaeota archaeon]
MRLAAALRALAAERMARELPLTEAAERLGVDVSTVSHYLRGDYPSERARNAARRVLERSAPFGLWPVLEEELGREVAAEVLRWLVGEEVEGRVRVDDARCVSCGRCREACPSPDACLGCAECVRACPTRARALEVRYRGVRYEVRRER